MSNTIKLLAVSISHVGMERCCCLWFLRRNYRVSISHVGMEPDGKTIKKTVSRVSISHVGMERIFAREEIRMAIMIGYQSLT